MIAYLDTSAVNYFADSDSQTKFNTLRSYGFDFFLSPITLWEVLLNSAPDRRDDLIYWIQFNCHNQLLKAPSEVLIDYIISDTPLKNRIRFWKDPFTKTQIGETWKNIHADITMTIPVDSAKLSNFTKGTHDLSKKFKRIITSMTDPKYEGQDSDFLFLTTKSLADKLDIDWAGDRQRHLTIAVILVLFSICVGFELDKSILRTYWQKERIDDPCDRLEFLVETKPLLFIRGPIAEMAFMVNSQISASKSKSRGLLHDCYHVIYAYFVDYFFTNDRHFMRYKNEINHEPFQSIILTEDIETLIKK